MATRTVTLDERAGCDIERTPYDIYRQLDHGAGGSAIAASTMIRCAVRAAIKKKLGRRRSVVRGCGR